MEKNKALKPTLIKEPRTFKLFWVTDGSDDWFIISPNLDEIGDYAELFHDEFECHESRFEDAPYNASLAEYVCDVPVELLNKLKRANPDGKQVSFIDISKENFIAFESDLMENKKYFIDDVYDEAFSDEFKKDNPLKSDKDYVNLMNDLWDYGDYDEIIDDMSQPFIAYLMMANEMYKYADYGYSPFHAQIDILKEIDGMSIIDDGLKSALRVVAYNGKLYSEGDMQAQIQDAWKIK